VGGNRIQRTLPDHLRARFCATGHLESEGSLLWFCRSIGSLPAGYTSRRAPPFRKLYTYSIHIDCVPNLPALGTWPPHPRCSGCAEPTPAFPPRPVSGSSSAALHSNRRVPGTDLASGLRALNCLTLSLRIMRLGVSDEGRCIPARQPIPTDAQNRIECCKQVAPHACCSSPNPKYGRSCVSAA
jgi:hypothetical protein